MLNGIFPQKIKTDSALHITKMLPNIETITSYYRRPPEERRGACSHVVPYAEKLIRLFTGKMFDDRTCQ